MEKDSDGIDQPQNLKEWISLFKQLRKKSLLKLESGKIQRGRRGHDVTLVLDCSGRMQGKSFTTMIEAATKYVNGIKQVKTITSLEDNIGLAVFGGTSGLIVESTSNYDLVLKEISQLRPGGEAPLFGGFLMGLSGVLGIGATSQILENEVPGYIIVFTDKRAGNTSIDKKNELDIDPLYFIGNAHEHDDMGSVISMIESHSIKIFYVPIGENIRNEVMEMAVSKTKGKVIPLNELHRLVKMTQELILAARVASDLRHTNPHPTADDVRLSISQRSSNPNDAHDDCVDLVLEFVDTLSADKNKGLYNELECRSLQLGDRVRRGPKWRHDKQDSGLAGTVVGQIQNEEVWVEWDSGHLNKYIYDEKVNFYSVKKVDEPRVLVDELVAVGCKVTRGNDWKYNNDDGGPGSTGTVLCVKDNGSVVVRWDCKKIGVYKMKTNDSFEIQICTDSPTYKQTAKVNLSTNKQKSAEFVIGNLDASTQKNTITSISKNSDQQEKEHNVKSVSHANTDSDSGNFSQPQNIREWLELSERLRKESLLKRISGKIQRGRHGHDVTLVLDCSDRMRGQTFTTMIESAKKYVNGIKQVKMATGLEDNIGLAAFGGRSGLIIESTSNYDLVLEEICKLRPGGEAPLFGGFLMGLSGVLGIGATSQIMDNEVQGYMIVFTDEMAGKTSTDKKNTFGIDPSYLIGNVHRHDEIGRVISLIASHLIKIFYVPIGDNVRNEVMEMAVSKTKGKIIPLNELHRLVKMTQELILAAQVASDLRHTNPNPTADDVRSSILQRTSNPGDAHDDCVDLVLEFVHPLSADKNKGLYNELECRSLQLGDRVRRGPNWMHEEQDSGRVGTVVGQDQDKEVWVEWDSGHLNIYIYNEDMKLYSIKKVQEPRVLVDELVAVGCKVTRGNDWKYDNDDGGPGSIGTVLGVKDNGSVVVRWDCRKIGVYKMKKNGLFEIQICNDSSSYKPSDSADVATNKQKGAEFANANQLENTAKSDKQMQEYDSHVNTENGSWFYKLVLSCDGNMVDIDSCESNRTCSNNGKWLLDVMSKGQTEISRYLNSLLAHKEKEFEILLKFSTLFKKNLIVPEDWLLPVVKHQHNMACYMILAYLTRTEKERKKIILPALEMAIGKGDKYITKIISWFIIKEFLKCFSFDINSLLDIWPAVVCKSLNCKDCNFCSQDLVILIQTEQPSHVLPIQFWNIKIKYLSQASEIEMKKEVKDHVYRNTKFTESASVEVRFPDNFNIDGKWASKLFKDHTNLTLICKAVYTLKDGIKNYRPCVQLFCKGKGLIPVEENHFPKFINNVKTDVLEGESLLVGRVRVGEQINSKHFSGTLGGFVKVLGKITFLTCAHVVLKQDNFSGHNLTIPSNEAIDIDYVQTLPNLHNSPTKCCGEVRYIEFKTDSPGETSIDAALIKLRKGKEIDEDDFIANKNNNKHHLQYLGMKSPFLNENWLDHDKIFYGKSALQFVNVTVGAVSGISVNTHSTKEKYEWFDIDMETAIETYKRIVQSENVSTFSSNAPVFSNDAHTQATRLSKVDKERTRYRLTRRMYNQIAVTHIPFQPGDSGTCIYVCDNSLERYGCIGMAIANHPGIDGGAIVTPMKDILKTFHVDTQ